MDIQKIRVLIVDDIPSVRHILKMALEKQGILDLHEAEDGELAWNLINKNSAKQFDLVICDWQMPEQLGIDLLRACRKDDRFVKIPFLMITAHSSPAKIQEARQFSNTEYLVKPFKNADLLIYIQKLLKLTPNLS